MVSDATSRAFPRPPRAPGDHPANASTSSAVPPTVQAATNPPAKRRRITKSGTSTPAATPSPAPTPILDLDALDAARRRAAGRVMSLWESLAEKYARGLDEDDEIDILTGKIYKDRGVLRSVSERGWKIGSFGEALEVEPLGIISEGETETGASEADDEGEVEDDTEGEGAEDAEEGEDDPFGGWSYDWQYRALPPPRPELSPQDAEDLKEFLAAEQEIQENLRKSGKMVDEQPDEDDGIVCLGTSSDGPDDTLYDDDDSEDEFASMAVDISTIRYMKNEDEEEADDVGPMSSILGDLAIRSSPQKPTSGAPLDSARGNEDDAEFSSPAKSDGDGHTQEASSSRASTSYTTARSATGFNTGSETGVDDDLIVIDSDTDDEVEDTVISRLKSGLSLDTPSKTASSPSKTSIVSHAEAQPASPRTPAAAGTSLGAKVLSRPTQPPKASFTAMATMIQASAVQTPLGNIPTSKSPPKASVSKSGTKPVSKRMLPRAGSKTVASKAPQANRVPHRSSNLPLTTTSVEPIGNSSTSTSEHSTSKVPAEASNKLPRPITGGFPVPTRRKVSATGISPDDNLALGSNVAAKSNSTSASDAPNNELPPQAPTASPPVSARPKSPIKPRKKMVLMEVVLPTPKRVSKIKLEPAPSPLSITPKDTAPITAASPTNSRSLSQATVHAPSLEINSSAITKGKAVGANPLDARVVGSGVESSLKRKRTPDGDGCVETTDNALGPRTHVELVDPVHPCCTPAPPGQNQNPVCCPAHFQHPTNLPPHAHIHHSASYPSCSSHQTHHHAGMPVYQHQHQHQHLHTHLPYPLPQLPFTANELTEAAFKLMYGLSALNHTSGASGSAGPGLWFPPGAHIPFGFSVTGQAGPSSPSLAPKLEASSSQDRLPTEGECIPSSQEHERKMEEDLRKAADAKRLADSIPTQSPATSDPNPVSTSSHLENLTPDRPNTPPNTQPHETVTTSPVATLSGPQTSTPKREMSVIDIDSDSEDEFAGYNIGEGSMRWEPPIKDEVDSDNESPLDLSGDSPRSERSSRQLRPRKSPAKSSTLRRASPVKARQL